MLSIFNTELINFKTLYSLGVIFYYTLIIYVPRIEKPRVESSESVQYSVVVFIIDALSQSNFLRCLPRTKNYLDSQGGILFRGHHKVGHNSYPNVMGLLSGELGDYPQDREGVYYLDLEKQALMQTVFRTRTILRT